jgi:transposase InsO family protein
MPWKSESVMDQRIKFLIRAKSNQASFSELCREFEISRPTGYLWLKRYEQVGSVTGLAEKSRRPHNSPLQTDHALEKLVVAFRKKQGWGARKIQVLLAKEGHQLGSATIHRILVREGLVEPDPADRKATKRFECDECNKMAQMDFKGEYQVREGKSYPLSFLDDHSRYAHGLWPLGSTNAHGVHDSLESRFREVGVPESILTDHGTPWFSTTNGHGLTWLSVWLIKQGIILKFSGIRHPQTHGKVERFHRTLKERTRHRGLPETLDEWRRWAPEFIQEYNYERPHEALGMKTPGEVYTHDNLRPYQENPREWEYTAGEVKRLNTQGSLYYRGRRFFVCEALANERVRTDELDGLLVVTFRETTVREINLRTGSSIAVVLDARKRRGSEAGV